MAGEHTCKKDQITACRNKKQKKKEIQDQPDKKLASFHVKGVSTYNSHYLPTSLTAFVSSVLLFSAPGISSSASCQSPQ